jgi:DNA-binding response OmpR family regulator
VHSGALRRPWPRRGVPQNPPDVIITDIMMPIMSGDQLIAEQRDLDLSGLPVLVLSARADESLCEHLLEHGAADYLNKPFGRAKLLALVENHMTMRKYIEALEEEGAARTAQLAQTQERIAHELSDTVINVSSAQHSPGKPP